MLLSKGKQRALLGTSMETKQKNKACKDKHSDNKCQPVGSMLISLFPKPLCMKVSRGCPWRRLCSWKYTEVPWNVPSKSFELLAWKQSFFPDLFPGERYTRRRPPPDPSSRSKASGCAMAGCTSGRVSTAGWITLSPVLSGSGKDLWAPFPALGLDQQGVH